MGIDYKMNIKADRTTIAIITVCIIALVVLGFQGFFTITPTVEYVEHKGVTYEITGLRTQQTGARGWFQVSPTFGSGSEEYRSGAWGTVQSPLWRMNHGITDASLKLHFYMSQRFAVRPNKMELSLRTTDLEIPKDFDRIVVDLTTSLSHKDDGGFVRSYVCLIDNIGEKVCSGTNIVGTRHATNPATASIQRVVFERKDDKITARDAFDLYLTMIDYSTLNPDTDWSIAIYNTGQLNSATQQQVFFAEAETLLRDITVEGGTYVQPQPNPPFPTSTAVILIILALAIGGVYYIIKKVK